MVAYFNKVRGGFELTLCAKPCNGAEFNNAEKIKVEGKREAKAVCKERGATPYNF
jgi:hypothetical protein